MDVRMAGGIVIFGLTATGLGLGLDAFFGDTATSSNNIFSAGTVDLKVNDQENIGSFIGGSNVKPGDTFSGTVTLRNAGNIPAVDLDMALSITSSTNGYSTEIPSRYLRISVLKYGDTNITIGDANGNGFPDLDDWDTNNGATRDLADPGTGRTLNLTLVFDESAGSALHGSSSTVTFTFYLAQVAAPDQPA